MKKNSKIFAVSVCLLFAGAFMIVNKSVSGTSLTDEQTILVRNNCTSTRATLNQIHANDALLRVNSGQIYESLATKLMEKFNTRLASNNVSNSALTSIAANYELTLDKFRQDYIIYEEQLAKTSSIDCQKYPETFYDSVANTRTKRAVVYENVSRLNQFINDYKAALAQLKIDYQVKSDGVKR